MAEAQPVEEADGCDAGAVQTGLDEAQRSLDAAGLSTHEAGFVDTVGAALGIELDFVN